MDMTIILIAGAALAIIMLIIGLVVSLTQRPLDGRRTPGPLC